MKVKMLEHFREKNVHYQPDQEVEVSPKVAAYLLEHRKAVEVSKPASRHDVEPQFENAEPPPKVRKTKRSVRRKKHEKS